MIPKRSVFALARALEGLPVLGTLSGTPAALAGIQYGDVLLSVNGVRTRTLADYLEAKDLLKTGMEAVVFRAGEERVTQLSYAGGGRGADLPALLAELVTLRVLEPEDDDVAPPDDGGAMLA